MKSGNLWKKTIVFGFGLFVLALGVALSVKADLGVSPVSCVPYVYSLKSQLTLGQLTIVMNASFVVLQILLLRRKYRLFQLIQLPSIMVFGCFIDGSMRLVSGLTVVSYGAQLLLCLVSCAVVAAGIFLEVKSGLTYLPCEGLAMTLSELWRKEFGAVKVGIDSCLVLFGLVSSFVLMHSLQGIREGTIIAALFIGFLVKFYLIKCTVLDGWLGNEPPSIQPSVSGGCPE